MTEPQLAMIDGRDALLMVLVKPGSGEGMVSVDAHCNGLDKLQAARILMHVAKSWKAEADATQQSTDPSQTPAGVSIAGPTTTATTLAGQESEGQGS